MSTIVCSFALEREKTQLLSAHIPLSHVRFQRGSQRGAARDDDIMGARRNRDYARNARYCRTPLICKVALIIPWTVTAGFFQFPAHLQNVFAEKCFASLQHTMTIKSIDTYPCSQLKCGFLFCLYIFYLISVISNFSNHTKVLSNVIRLIYLRSN